MERNRQQVADEALALWTEMTGGGSRLNLGNWHADSMFRELHEARDLDPSGVTCFMLLRAFTQAWAQERHVDAWAILRGFPDPADRALLDKLRRMIALLDGQEDVREEETLFRDLVRRAVASYDALRDDVEEWLGSDYAMAVLRRDALRSMRTLTAHQFCQGRPAPDADRPKYGTVVYEMWNMPSLVRALAGQRMPGVSVVLIRDEAVTTASFFCLAVGNGENAIVLTDREAGPHPDFKRMARRPGRDLDQRAARHHFPYELLTGGKTDGRGDATVEKRSSLVRIQEEATVLAPLESLAPDTVIWLTLVFELVRQEYFLGGKTLPELSYTKEMIRDPHALVKADHALVQAGVYRPLDLAPLTHEDVASAAPALVSQWERPPIGHHQWMIDRYGPQVPAEVFNLVGGPDDVRRLPGHEAGGPRVDSWDMERFQGVGNTEAERALVEIGAGKGGHSLRTVDPVTFGTRDEVKNDVTWTARRNLCVVVQRLAMREYDETKGSIYERATYKWNRPSGWYLDHILRRKDWLVDAAVRGALAAPAQVPRLDHSRTFADTWGEEDVNILKVTVSDGWGHDKTGWAALFLHSPEGRFDHCAVTGVAPSYFAVFRPQDSRSIALLTGVSEERLPWQLKVWKDNDDLYCGNHILDRLDPADWLLSNPWARHTGAGRGGLDLSVGLCLGRRFVNRRRRELGLAPVDWDPKKSD